MTCIILRMLFRNQTINSDQFKLPNFVLVQLCNISQVYSVFSVKALINTLSHLAPVSRSHYTSSLLLNLFLQHCQCVLSKLKFDGVAVMFGNDWQLGLQWRFFSHAPGVCSLKNWTKVFRAVKVSLTHWTNKSRNRDSCIFFFLKLCLYLFYMFGTCYCLSTVTDLSK